MNSQVIVIDAKGHLFGRLASIVSKQLLQGQHVVRINFGDARAFAMGAIIAARARTVEATERDAMASDGCGGIYAMIRARDGRREDADEARDDGMSVAAVVAD
mgnify:CR=1 FL=1